MLCGRGVFYEIPNRRRYVGYWAKCIERSIGVCRILKIDTRRACLFSGPCADYMSPREDREARGARRISPGGRASLPLIRFASAFGPALDRHVVIVNDFVGFGLPSLGLYTGPAYRFLDSRLALGAGAVSGDSPIRVVTWRHALS